MNNFHIKGVILDLDDYDVQIAHHRPLIEDKATRIKHDGEISFLLRIKPKASSAVLYSFEYKELDELIEKFSEIMKARGVYHKEQLNRLKDELSKL